MRFIQTVAGRVQPEDLGFTQSHEHILLRKGKSFQVNKVLWQDDTYKSGLELEDYRLAGGSALVDAQPVGCGRMAREMAEISESSGIKIIASTGFHKLIFYPEDHWIQNLPGKDLEELFVSELKEGMFEDGDDAYPEDRTGIAAGQIKTALDTEGLTPRYTRLFLAAASAQKRTGAPVMIHIENGADPEPVFDLFTGEGVPAEKLIFCHLDRACADFEKHLRIARAGAWLEYDTIGRFKYHSDEEEIRLILELFSAGLQDRLLCSLDTTRARLGRYGGDISLTYLIRAFLPALQAAGAAKEQIEKMTVLNPAAAFSINA